MSSMVDPGMSIPELIEMVKQSFREREFDEVRDILMGREEKLKMEIENRRTDHESAKKEARLLEEKLRSYREKCTELNLKISSLETTVGKMEKENEILRQERNELKRRNDEAAHESAKKEAQKLAESEKLQRSLKKCNELNAMNSSLETTVGKMEKENEILRQERNELKRRNDEAAHESAKKEAQKLAESEKLQRSLKKCNELNAMNSSLGTRVRKMEKLEKELEVLRHDRDELKRQNDELRREKNESDEKAERYKIRDENLEPRVKKVEAALSKLLNVKVEDLAPFANALDKSDDAAAKGKNVDIESDKVNEGLGKKKAIQTEPQRCWRADGKGWRCKRGALPNLKYCELHVYRLIRSKKHVPNTQSVNYSLPHLENGDSSTKDDGANTAQNSPGSQSGGSPRVEPQDPGDSSTKDDGANTAQASPGSQSGGSPRVEPQDPGDSSIKDDGANTAQTSPGSQSGGSPRVEPQDPVKATGAPAMDLIMISDTDDETNSDDKLVSYTSLAKRKKRSRIYISDEDDDIIPIDGKEPESTHDKVTPLIGVACDDSDDDSSCSDGHMNSLVAIIRSREM